MSKKKHPNIYNIEDQCKLFVISDIYVHIYI